MKKILLKNILFTILAAASKPASTRAPANAARPLLLLLLLPSESASLAASESEREREKERKNENEYFLNEFFIIYHRGRI